MSDEKRIVAYYDNCQADYELVWDLKKSLSMHYGYWDKSTKSFSDALMNINRVMARRAKISSSDKVLDAGCGVGGSSICLAKNFGCTVVGITLSQNQAGAAERNAKKNNATGTVAFLMKNFNKTGFPAKSFDVVWAIESAGYASRKKDFLKEAYRILRKKGRLIVADGFKTGSLAGADEKLINKAANGWALPEPATISEFITAAKSAGFRKTRATDETAHIMPSAQRLYRIARLALPFAKLLRALKIRNSIQTANVVTACLQYKTLKKGLWKYFIISAQK